MDTNYAPLKTYLKTSGSSHIPLNFTQIEDIIGRKLPPSARDHRAWWSNNPSNNPFTYSWLDAGYKTAQVDMAAEKLVFIRNNRSFSNPFSTPFLAPSSGVAGAGGMATGETKYAPLEAHLKAAGFSHIQMTFSEIERIINAELPPSARKHRAWWSNNPRNGVITYSWLNAGYKSAQVDMAAEKLVFVKNGDSFAPSARRVITDIDAVENLIDASFPSPYSGMATDERKYAPLEAHLKATGFPHIQMSFSEIEGIINAELPPSARKHRHWWSNNPQSSVITYAWLNAGYKTAQVDMVAETLTFVKSSKEGNLHPSASTNENNNRGDGRHPAFGSMKDTVTITESVDLAKPEMPEWGEMTENPNPYDE